MKKTIIYLVTIALSCLFVFGLGTYLRNDVNVFSDHETKYTKVQVTAIKTGEVSASSSADSSLDARIIYFKAKAIGIGAERKTLSCMQLHDDSIYTKYKVVEVGDKILVTPSADTNGNSVWSFVNYYRSTALLVSGIILCLLVLLFGKVSGLNALISLGFTILSVFSVFVPAILSGRNVYLWALITAMFIVSMTLILVNGWNKKSLTAAIGCAGGLASSGLVLYIMDFFLNITGVVDEQSIYLTLLDTENPLDLKAIVYGAMILGAIGAIMDVAVNIASSLYEIRQHNPDISGYKILRSGINIGRDIMGTMMNTLILAYVGGSLSLVLILYVYFSNTPMHLFNTEMIVVEVLQSLVGSFGLILTIPLTSYVSSLLYRKKQIKTAESDN